MRWNNTLHAITLIGVIAVCALAISALMAAETPHGRVSGVITTTDMQQPLPHIAVYLTPSVKPGEQRERSEADNSYAATTDDEGRFTFPYVAQGPYQLSTATRAHKDPDLAVTVTDNSDSKLTVALKPTEPFLNVFRPQSMYTTRETPELRCEGFVPTDTLAVQVYRIAPAAAVRAWQDYLPDALTLRGHDWQTARLRTVPELSLTKTMTTPVVRRDSEGVFRTKISLGQLPPALYLIAIASTKTRALAVVAVTDLGLVLKAVPGKALAYAVNLLTGAPVAGAPVDVWLHEKRMLRSQTDASGLARLTLNTSGDDNQIEVVARQGASMAVASVYLWSPNGTGTLHFYTYTDRPVYRPGQLVYFKSLVRAAQGNGYRVPAAFTAKVHVTDAMDDVVYTGTVRSNRFGSLFGAFSLDGSALPGSYTLTLQVSEQQGVANFSVAEYRKPEFDVRVTTARKRYAIGETLSAEVDAQYYFGAPVANARVHYTVTRQPNWYYDDEESWNADLPPPANNDNGGGAGGGEVVAEGDAQTDAGGRAMLSVPTTVAPPERGSPNDTTAEGWDWNYTVEAEVTDDSHHLEDGAGDVLVTQGDFRLQASTPDYLCAPGQAETLTIQARDYENIPVVGVRGRALVEQRQWVHDTMVATPEESENWQTDAHGNAVITITPRQQGDYHITLLARDAHGRSITGTASLWVMGEDSADFAFPYQDLDVRMDKRIYRIGDTAKVLVNTRYAPQHALMTVESDGLLEPRQLELRHKSTVISIPVRADYLPNVHIGVCFVKGKALISGTAILNVSRISKALHVRITPDKTQYEPGERASFTVQTSTPAGTPAASECSFGLVDEAIYAIQPDDTPNIITDFYPRRENEAITSFSFPEIYFSGDEKAGATVKTRRYFPDTAYWNPSVVTDKTGVAHVTVTLPDSLTTWRATCRAMTMDTRVGEQTATILVQKPFLVRLETPRFLTQGDSVQIGLIAHNLTNQPLTTQLGMNVTGAEVDGALYGTYHLAAGKTQRVTWTVHANTVGTATFRAWGIANPPAGAPLNDAMALSLPVVIRGRLETEAHAGSVTAQKTLTFPATGDAIPGTTRLAIRLSPSYASALLDSLDYLAAYPYGCTEQTMSCFLPDVVVLQLLHHSGASNPQLSREVPKMVTASLLRLYALQHGDGGWGWWTYDASDPWMTAYVVFGLTRAQAAGFPVNPQVLSRGIAAMGALAQQSNGAMVRSGRAFLAYQLAVNGQRDAANHVVREYLDPTPTPRLAATGDWGRSMLALALYTLGRTDDARALLDGVWADYAAGRLGKDRTPHGMYPEFYTVTDDGAALLYAATIIIPTDTREQALVEWLLDQREDNHWESTRDTAFALYGISRYLIHSGELRPNLNAVVSLYGAPLLAHHFVPADVAKPDFVFNVPNTQRAAGPITLSMARQGQGKLYYTVTRAQMTSASLESPKSADATLTIQREYRLYRPVGAPSSTRRPYPPTTTFTAGDIVEVTLRVKATRPFGYLMVEDHLPAGCEAEDHGAIDPEEWNYWWCNEIVRDQTVSFALNALPANETREISYHLDADTPGVFLAMPARIFDMYHPQSWADSGAQGVTIH